MQILNPASVLSYYCLSAKDRTREMWWNKWPQRILPQCTQSVLWHGQVQVAVKTAIEGNKYFPIHLGLGIWLNGFISSEVKKLSSAFKPALCF